MDFRLRPEALTFAFLKYNVNCSRQGENQSEPLQLSTVFCFSKFWFYMSSVRIQIGLSIQASVHQGWLDITAICAILRFPFLRRAYKERNRRTAAGPWLFLNNSRTCCLCSSVPCFLSCPLAMLDDRIPCRSCFSCISSGLL